MASSIHGCATHDEYNFARRATTGKTGPPAEPLDRRGRALPPQPAGGRQPDLRDLRPAALDLRAADLALRLSAAGSARCRLATIGGALVRHRLARARLFHADLDGRAHRLPRRVRGRLAD